MPTPLTQMLMLYFLCRLGSLCQDNNETKSSGHKKLDNRHTGHPPYVPNWSDILPPPPPLELPPPIPSVSSSQILRLPGSTPQSPKTHPKKSLYQTQNVIIFIFLIPR